MELKQGVLEWYDSQSLKQQQQLGRVIGYTAAEGGKGWSSEKRIGNGCSKSACVVLYVASTAVAEPVNPDRDCWSDYSH